MSYSFRSRSGLALAAGVAVSTLALGACGAAGNTSIPARAINTRPAVSRLVPTGTAPRAFANPCPGISDAEGEHGGARPLGMGIADALGDHGVRSPITC